MRTHWHTRLSKKSQAGVLFLLLATSSLVFGQAADPIDPVIGPMVRIISPANHEVFFAPVNIPILAYVVDSLHTTNVEFFANSTYLGSGFKLGTTPSPAATTPNFVLPSSAVTRLGAIYCFVWSNAPPGSYALTAVTQGTNEIYTPSGSYISSTSPPVDITVLPRTILTNGPSVVSIVATDPIAIVGSNSWIWPGLSNATPAWTNWPPPTAVSCTNWGPKDALFTVRRFGNEASPVTVNYSISGTASNGVDYVKLPGYVSFPAGSAYCLIPIVPIDHGPPYVPLTVTLTLTPDTNLPPQYIIGFPPRATAIIIHDWLRPPPPFLPDGSFHFYAPGPDGSWFTLASSADLQNWTPICTNQVVQGAIDFVDGNGPSNAQQFYQATPQANPPSQ